MKTFRISSFRVIVALAFIAAMLAIIVVSARGAAAADTDTDTTMRNTHGCVPTTAVVDSKADW